MRETSLYRLRTCKIDVVSQMAIFVANWAGVRINIADLVANGPNGGRVCHSLILTIEKTARQE